MSTSDTTSDVVATYRKHGWVLRRLLLTKSSIQKLAAVEADIIVHESDIDIAWFSRPPESGGVAWEIRYLGDPPYALVENLDESSSEFETKLKDIEASLRKSVTAKKPA